MNREADTTLDLPVAGSPREGVRAPHTAHADGAPRLSRVLERIVRAP